VDLKNKKIAILGYGNQGRAQALNLRDSGFSVLIGSREGKSFDQALQDGFKPLNLRQASEASDILIFLLSDLVISSVYVELADLFSQGQRAVGFSHGYAFQFGGIERFCKTSYFLVGPKGAGAVLRKFYQEGKKLPGVLACVSPDPTSTRELAKAYAKAIGISEKCLVETTFQEETECDLFGEQAVLCGGILELMESAFEILVEKGHSPQMAFLECCYEAQLILDLWMSEGPSNLSQKISPTAFYGGWTRGKRLINHEVRSQMRALFDEIRGGAFSKEWEREASQGYPQLKARLHQQKGSLLEKTYFELKNLADLNPNS